MKRLLTASFAVVGLVGCAAMDRESYSLVIVKKAHRYQDPLPPLADPVEEAARAKLPEGYPTAPLEKFRPFTYCHLHQSSHEQESFLAVGLAPIEYPVALAIHTGASSILALLRALASLLGIPGAEPTPFIPDPEEKRR